MANKTPLDQLNTAISKILQEYSDEVSINMDVMVQKACQKGAQTVRSEAATKLNGKSYQKSWTYKVEKSRLHTDGIIYSKQPGLPHLLEHGHVIRSGGRVTGQARAFPHIAPVAEKLVNEFEREVEKKL